MFWPLGVDVVPRILVSVPWTSSWDEASASDYPGRLHIIRRRCDYGLGKFTKIAFVLRESIFLFWEARRGVERVVIATSMVEVLVVSLFFRLLPNVRLVVWDFLLPTSPGVRRLSRRALRRVDEWLVIRRGDMPTLFREFGALNTRFVPFPAPDVRIATANGSYVYAAGVAHREWDLLVAAAYVGNIPVVISTSEKVEVPESARRFVDVIPLASPEEGRNLMAAAAAVCVPLRDTELPCGPLVILDAMAMGKPVIATNVNGARDYIRDGVTGFLTEPGDVQGLARAMGHVINNPTLRGRMAEAAAESLVRLSPERILLEIAGIS